MKRAIAFLSLFASVALASSGSIDIGSGSGGGASGAAGGDLSGTYPNPSVSTIGGSTSSNIHAVDALVNGSKTANTFLSAPDGAGGLASFRTIVTGDLPSIVGTVKSIATGTGLSGGTVTSAGTISLANTAVTAGTYTHSSITVDSQGRLTSAANGASINLASGVTGTLPIANGGTGSTTFTGKTGNIAGLVFFDGSTLVNDSTVTDIGYDTSLNKLNIASMYSSGNVGIGTTAPVAPLHTVGVVTHMSGNVGIGTTAPLYPTHTVGNVYHAAGNVGIGTSSGLGGYKLSVNGDIEFRNGSDIAVGTESGGVFFGGGFKEKSGGNAGALTYSTLGGTVLSQSMFNANPVLIIQNLDSGSTGDYLQIKNSAGTVLSTIKAGGNVGIGTTLPTSILQVVKTDTQTSGTGAAGIRLLPTYNQASGSAANTDFLINRTQTALGSGAQLLIDAQVGGTSKFSVSNLGGVAMNSSSTLATGRAVDTTASLATITIAASTSSTYIATPGAALTVTLAAPVADGERRKIVFGQATTVTWAVTSPATAVAIPKTVFAAGDSIEVVYNSAAGTPANSAATTWYEY